MIALKLSRTVARPRDWIESAFGHALILIDCQALKDALMTVLRGTVPDAFFGPDYEVLEVGEHSSILWSGQACARSCTRA